MSKDKIVFELNPISFDLYIEKNIIIHKLKLINKSFLYILMFFLLYLLNQHLLIRIKITKIITELSCTTNWHVFYLDIDILKTTKL